MYKRRSLVLLFLVFATLANIEPAWTAPAAIEIPPHPIGFPTNGTWSVYCRGEGSDEWREIPVALVRPGYQELDEPFAKTVGLEQQGPYAASLVRFSFSGNLEIKAVFNKGDLRTAAIVPKSYGIKAQPNGNEIKFTISQNSTAPRKIVIRPNDNWEEDVLHILTNPPEDRAPSEMDPAVLCIEPGDPIPEVLPAGKTTYFFKPGIHRLPQGLWLDIDLGSMQTVNSFDLLTGGQRKWLVPGPLKYRISYRDREDAPWRTAVENLTNDSIEIKGGVLPAFQARYVRLTLMGNTSQERTEGLYYVNSTHLTQFRLFGPDKGRDLAAGRAYRGAVPGFERVTGNNSHWGWGDMNGGESFFAAGDGITFYLAPGSVVKGSLAGNGRKNITIKGRGIIDGSELLHEPSKVYREARTGTLRFHNCTNVLLEGICILDSPMWSMQFKGSTDVTVRHIDFIGNIVNADGVHLSAVKNGLVEGCFLRAPDDLICVYHYGPSENLTVRNCVFWNDGGSIALIGIADNKGDIRNVTMEECDILTSQGVWTGENAAAIHIAATAGNTISGVVLRDVRIEPFRFPSTTALLMIKAKEFKIGVHRYPPGRVSDVLFDRVTYDGGGETPSFIQGTDADHAVKGVVFKDFKWGDSLLSLENRPNLQVRQFSEVTFFPAAPIWITDFSPPADPIEIKSISKITEPTWPDGSLYWAFSLTLDQPVGSDKFNNNMQRGGDEQADPLLKQAVRENIKLDGKTLGELLTLHKDEWAVMVTYKENLITIIAKKAFPILTQDSGHRVEIRPGLLDITKSKHFKGATYSYDGVSRAWSMTKAPPSSDGR